MKDFFSKYGIWILAAATGIAVLLSLLSYYTSTSTVLHNAAGVAISPFRRASETVSRWVEDKKHYYQEYNDLLEENAALRAEVAELRANARQADRDREENALFRELIGLREQRRELEFESAMILERSANNWTRTLTLNRGTSHGVAVKNVVLSSEGYLIGVVTEAGLNWCTVQTIIDTDTELGALLFRTGDVVMAEGDFALMQEKRLKVTYLPEETPLLVGDYIVTSGLGGYYPSNIVIGKVESVEADDDGLVQYAVLVPMLDFDALTEVFVVKSFDIVE
ncbi:MAG: rod shape-determining protein MreC [Oscillospiraceae bacterium]|nr:rod shape-determining protein MreC [Oscillospiraceae bacterium]